MYAFIPLNCQWKEILAFHKKTSLIALFISKILYTIIYKSQHKNTYKTYVLNIQNTTNQTPGIL